MTTRLSMMMSSAAREYGLVSSGTQYINTQHAVASNNYRIVARVKRHGTGTGVAFNGSNTTGDYSTSLSLYFMYEGMLFLVAGNPIFNSPSIPFPSDTVFDIDAVASNNQKSAIINGVHYPNSAYTGTVANANPSFLFANNVRGNVMQRISATIYSFKMFDNDVSVRDFIPVPAGSTRYSTIPAPSNCMWCKVTGKYYENAGSGEFGIEEVTA